ncbi:MAG: hypothetical protein KYX69_00245 [Sphingomonas sp.]|uniref:hypothetical protein n=1 Tax=Sphingomonas sp. TaxID=28214 RepID=UPI0026074711|nr:hypothetical protein [Sphingomonas sp.]MDK2766123.1 hypothetical protein [Sphingomonas sp.]
MNAGFDAWSLGWESAAVIGLRAAKIAQGGPEAQRETERMVSEKMTAAFELQMAMMSGAMGVSPATTTRKALAHYRRKVRANARRLR